MPIGRRERAKQDRRERLGAGAPELFAEHGVGGVTNAGLHPLSSTEEALVGDLLVTAANPLVGGPKSRCDGQ